MRLGLGIWAMVGALETTNLFVFNRKYRLSMMFYALGTVIDFTIAVSLVCLLMKHRKSSFKKYVMSYRLARQWLNNI
jgi:predicted membrane protein